MNRARIVTGLKHSRSTVMRWHGWSDISMQSIQMNSPVSREWNLLLTSEVVQRETMKQNKTSRIVSAGTWIVIQDALVKGAAFIAGIGLVGYIGALLYGSVPVASFISTVGIVLPIVMIALSWGFEEFRMNGMPFEETVAGWVK